MHLFASRRMDGKTSQLMSWFVFQELLPVLVMTALYSRDVYTLWFKQQVRKMLSYKYSRFSLLLASRERQKFHTDDVKSVENLVRNSDWLTQQLYCFTCCLPMTDKRQKATKVKCKRGKSTTKQSIFQGYILLQKKHHSRTQNFNKIDQEKHKIKQIYIWNPVTTGFIMQTLIYVISMEFLLQRRRRSHASGEERGETAVFGSCR